MVCHFLSQRYRRVSQCTFYSQMSQCYTPRKRNPLKLFVLHSKIGIRSMDSIRQPNKIFYLYNSFLTRSSVISYIKIFTFNAFVNLIYKYSSFPIIRVNNMITFQRNLQNTCRFHVAVLLMNVLFAYVCSKVEGFVAGSWSQYYVSTVYAILL